MKVQMTVYNWESRSVLAVMVFDAPMKAMARVV